MENRARKMINCCGSTFYVEIHRKAAGLFEIHRKTAGLFEIHRKTAGLFEIQANGYSSFRLE